MSKLEQLDEETQRRLVLRAAREAAPSLLGEMRRHQPTIDDLKQRIRRTGGSLAASLIGLVVCPLIPLWVWSKNFSRLRDLRAMRRALRRSYSQWLLEPDPEITHWALEGDLQRLLEQLPDSQSAPLEQIAVEVERVAEHWSTFSTKLKLVREMLTSEAETDLFRRLAELEARQELERDPVARQSLERQAQSLEARRQARSGLVTWERRLQTAQDECTETLFSLRSQLTLMATADEQSEQAVVQEATAGLRRLNMELAATQAATEEVLRIAG